MNRSLNNLIAKDIVNLGRVSTSSFNYIIYMDEYLKLYSEQEQILIKENIQDILKYAESDESVASLDYDERDNSISIVYYIDSVLDRLENMIYNFADVEEFDLELDEIRGIADAIYQSETLESVIINRVEKDLGGKENEM